MPVLFEEQLYLGLRNKYVFPPYLVEGYQNFSENINKHSLTDPYGVALASLEDFAATKLT